MLDCPPASPAIQFSWRHPRKIVPKRVFLSAVIGALFFAVGPIFAHSQTPEIKEKLPDKKEVKVSATANADSPEKEDALVLREAGLSPDDIQGVLRFFKTRTLAEVDRSRIESLLQKLASEDFTEREEGELELEKIGSPAVALLRQTRAKSDDAEVRFLCDKVLRHIEKVAGPTVSSAAARTVAHRKPAGAAQILIDYLPFADDTQVSDEVDRALQALAMVDGRANPDLVAALENPSSLKRSASADALIRGGTPAIRQNLYRMLKDKDPHVVLRVASALCDLKDLEAAPYLIALLGEGLPLSDARRAELILIDLAGELAPKTLLAADVASRAKAREAWQQWWKTYDGKGILAAFRRQTPSDEEVEAIKQDLQRLNLEGEARQKAIDHLTALGPKAASLLRQAYRGEIKPKALIGNILRDIEKNGPLPAIPDLARLLILRPAEGAIPVLLAYVPVCDEEAAEEIYNAMARLGVTDGKPKAALTAALGDKIGGRRAAAALALARAGAMETFPAISNLLGDPDLTVRLKVALALIPTGRKEAVPILIDLLAKIPVNQGWEAEDMLYRLAEDKAPSVMLGDEASRKRCRDAWVDWWKTNANKINLSRLERGNPFLGYTLVVSMGRGRGLGQIQELGRDGKPRWHFEGLNFPIDAQVISNNRVLVAEYSANAVTERTFKGEVLWKKDVNLPMACQRLPNGNTFIASQNQILEVDRTGKEIFAIPRPNHDVMYAVKLRNGQIIVMSNMGSVSRLDSTGKEISQVSVNPPQVHGSNMEVLPNGHFLIPHYGANKIHEYDAEGKSVWEADVTRPISVSRLPNGHTLAGSLSPGQILELDRSGKKISETRIDGRIMRVRRR